MVSSWTQLKSEIFFPWKNLYFPAPRLRLCNSGAFQLGDVAWELWWLPLRQSHLLSSTPASTTQHNIPYLWKKLVQSLEKQTCQELASQAPASQLVQSSSQSWREPCGFTLVPGGSGSAIYMLSMKVQTCKTGVDIPICRHEPIWSWREPVDQHRAAENPHRSLLWPLGLAKLQST